MPLAIWIALAAIAFCGISALIGVALGTAMDRLGRTPKPPFRPSVVPDPDEPSYDGGNTGPGGGYVPDDVADQYPREGDVCDVHGCDLVWTDSGSAESGPGEPYLTCPKCDEEHAPHCPRCGRSESEGFEHRAIPTRNYGGGWDTVESCVCGHREVYV